MKEMKRVLALLLCFVMLVGYVPVGAFATEEDATAPSVEETIATEATDAAVETTEAAQTETTAVAEEMITFDLGVVSAEAMGVDTDLDDINTAMERAKTYINALTINNSSNDPATVVKNFKTHFTWDNEKREGKKDYLFDWSYYNGVVFEGLEYLYEATGEAVYKDYVMEYMSSLIASNGTWAKCTNSGYTSKECAGYKSTHGADCYKTASLLMDAYEMSGDSRYLTIAATLYADLDTAAANSAYNLSNAGNNFRHTWASDPSPDLWLDGLYMILPFRAEYAKHIGDTEELDLIVDRLQWVSDNMCDDEGDANDTGLFYHAADNATSNSGTFWLRSIGWYAAAIVDVMDSMEGENLEAMKVQLKKLADNMIAYQNEYGMWANNMKQGNSVDRYETSGTSLVCYAIMKGVNKGWLGEEYADAALLALRGITTHKLDAKNANLTDICYIGNPGSSNSTFYDNEGKGVGPFIMLYAEVVKYFAEEELPVVTVTFDHANADRFEATGKGLTSIEAVLDETTDYSTIFDTNNAYGAYDIRLGNFPEGETVELTMSIYGVEEENLVVYKINADGSKTEIADVEVFCSEDLPGYLNATFDIESVGIYAMGTRFVEIPEGAVLTKVEITEDPATVYYFVEELSALSTLSLDITDLVVEATYSNGEETVTKEIYWDEFGAVENGYSLTFDMTQLGKQDVVVSYTYGGVTLTDTFGIEVVAKFIPVEIPEIKFELTIPGPVTVKVQENTEDPVIKEAMEKLVTVDVYISYKFDLTGYIQGNEVKLTLPLPEGEGAGVAYYVPEDGSAPQKIENAVENADGTITFTTDHFSTYASGRAAPVTGTGNLVGGTTYKLDTNGVTANKNYLIVNTGSNGTGYALTNNDSNTPGSTPVTIEGGKITVDDDSKIAWVFSGSTSGTVKNTAYNSPRYVYLGSRDVLSTSTRTLTIENRNNGAYRIYRTSMGSTYYLRYNSGSWSRTGTATNVYLFEYDSASNGEAVIFSVDPSSANVRTGTAQPLTAKVTVGEEPVEDLSKCTISWTSDNSGVASVSDSGVVTGVKKGDTNIKATLTAVDGTALQTPIQLTIPITVSDVSIVSMVLESNTGTVYVNSSTEANTGAKVKITYEDGSIEYENVYVNMVSGSYDLAKVDSYENLTVTYNNTQLAGTFTLNVVEKHDMNFPEFPDPGSVFLDKYIKDSSQFQDAGVAEINLVTSGLPAKAGVDVILVTDLSNSMAWAVGGRTDASSFEATKMYDLQQSVTAFAETFLAGEHGMPTNNTISLVTFGGYDADNTTTKMNDYADTCQTLLLGSNSIPLVSSTIQDIRVIADDVIGETFTDGYGLSFDGGKTYQNNYGNTNYDHAFMETYAAVNALKAQYKEINSISYEESGREIYILFMTDGAPSNYDGVYYNYKTGARADVYCQWINEDGDKEQYVMGNNRAQYQAGPWFEYIAGGAYNAANETIPGNPLYWADKVDQMPSVKEIFSIGFDIDNGGFSSMTFTKDDGRPLAKVLEHLVAGKKLDVYEADDAGALQQVYEHLASELKLAATNAYFVDQMGDNFSIQMASTVVKFKGTKDERKIDLNPVPQIKISSYEIYTPDDVNGSTVTADMIGKRKGTAPAELEIVTFNAGGTAAYSNQLGATTDILGVDGVIDAKYFWYNTKSTAVMIDTNGDGTNDYSLPGETFYWNIGTINNQEFVMSYYVYLDGSAEGKKPEGTYATNNYATLYYKNWLGNDVSQSVDTPALAWESASVYYGFYLVDRYGNPVVNRATGETGTFADAVRVTPKIFYEEVFLNEIDDVATIKVASTRVPEGYEVYDKGAKYTIRVDSKLAASGWEIENKKNVWVDSDRDGVVDSNEYTNVGTTYVTDYKGNEYTNILDSDNLEDTTGCSFTATTVWFAVVWEPSTVPDVVVIDYGLPVDIGVLENDLFGTAGTLIGVGEADKKPTKVVNGETIVIEGNHYSESDSANFTGSELTLDYGTAKINGAEVRYTPATMAMDSYDTFAYEVLYNNATTQAMEYYYGDVTVIPATFIYYEDTFQENTDGGITYTHTITAGKESVCKGWKPVGKEIENATQQEDRPGQYSLPVIDANNIYGYDAIYADASSNLYSLGSAMKVTVDANSYADAEFSFWGTGFDIISLTSNTTGILKVTVTDESGAVVDTVAVDTYYGYAYSEEDGWHAVESTDENAIYQVPVIKLSGMPYGKYKASLRVAYYGVLDHNSKVDGYDFYLDAVRIYNPAGDGTVESDTIQDAYEMDKEGWPLHIEMRNEILDANTFGLIPSVDEDGNPVSIPGAVFIDHAPNKNGQPYTVSDYSNYGPNNELYLAPGQAVSFVLDLSQYIYGTKAAKDLRNIVEDVQIQAKSADGNPVAVKLSNTAIEGTREFKTGTSMYYSIKNYMDLGTQTETNVGVDTEGNPNKVDEDKDAKTTLVFENTGKSGIVSFTNIKIVFSENPYGTATGSLFKVSKPAIDNVLAMLNAPKEEIPEVEETEPEETEPEVTEPEVTEPEETEPEVTEPEETLDADLKVNIRNKNIKVGSSVVVMATTSRDVDALTVNGKRVSHYVENRRTGVRTWTTTIKAEQAGDLDVKVVAFGDAGKTLATCVETISVTGKKASVVEQIIGTIIGVLLR